MMTLLSVLSLIVPVMILIASSANSDVLAWRWRIISVLHFQLCVWIAWIVGAVYGIVKYAIAKAKTDP